MIITEIRKIGKGQRYYLFVDNDLFGVFEAEILARHCLKTGQDFDKSFFDNLTIENGDYACFNRGLVVLSKSMKSEKMLKDYLKEKKYPTQCIDKAVLKLKEYDYINDELFCQNYISCYCNQKSKKKLKYDLLSKGIDENIIEKNLENINDEDEFSKAYNIAVKYLKNKTYDLKTKQKTFNYLIGKGFDFSVIQNVWEEISNDRN